MFPCIENKRVYCILDVEGVRSIMPEWFEVIYYIIVPVIGIVLAWVLQNLNEGINHDKQWKQVKEKSSVDIYLNYFILVMVLGFAWNIVVIIFSCLFAFVFHIYYYSNMYNIIVSIVSIIPYVIVVLLKICKKIKRKLYLLEV